MRTIRWLLAPMAFFCGLAGACAFVGCGDDTATAGDAAAGDATTDSTDDGGADVSSDTSRPDAADSQPDTVVVTDSGFEADADGGTPLDAPADVYDASALLAFPPQQAAARCAALAACCGTSADASTFNLAQCVADTVNSGGFKGSTSGVAFAPYGNINFNPASAQACLADFTQINCTTDQIPSSAEIKLYQDCFGAYSGILAAGAPCHASIECQSGEYCNGADGGVCTALQGVGGPCGTISQDPANILPQSQCSYRGAGANGNFCQEFQTGSPTTPLDAAAWTCQPQLANGAGCIQNQDCQSYQCSANACATSIVAFSAGQCATYMIADAGGGD